MHPNKNSGWPSECKAILPLHSYFDTSLALEATELEDIAQVLEAKLRVAAAALVGATVLFHAIHRLLAAVLVTADVDHETVLKKRTVIFSPVHTGAGTRLTGMDVVSLNAGEVSLQGPKKQIWQSTNSFKPHWLNRQHSTLSHHQSDFMFGRSCRPHFEQQHLTLQTSGKEVTNENPMIRFRKLKM